MVDKYKNDSEITIRKDKIIKSMVDSEYYPNVLEDEVSMGKYVKLPISKLAALGTGVEPLTIAIQNILNGGGKSGLYRVEVPDGMSLAEFTKKPGYLGSSLKENGQVGGQATLKPLLCNPTMLFMAAALISIDQKLDKIQEIQQEMLDFLVQKQRSELKGDLNFLSDILLNYKYNWDNDKYKNNNHIKVLDIKQAAEIKIDFYREQIKSKINKKSFLHTGQFVKKQLEKVQLEFKDYQLALYLYAFSSFLEVILLENFDSEYLDKISNKIEEYSYQYRLLYTKSYNQFESKAKSSIESHIVKNMTNSNKFVGKAISKAPIFKEKNFDEKFIETGDKLGEFGLKRIDNTMKKFVKKQSSEIYPFVENINEVNKLYNQKIEFIFDEENIYLGV